MKRILRAVMELRKKYAAAYEQKGARLTLTSFALKIAAQTLKKHPAFNSSLDEAAQEIVTKSIITSVLPWIRKRA